MAEQPKNLGREPLDEIVLGREPLEPTRRFTYTPELEETPRSMEKNESKSQ